MAPLTAVLCALISAGCGGGTTTSAGGGTTATVGGPPRPGGAVDLQALIPADALVVLHANLSTVRQDPARYSRIAAELAQELQLSAEADTIRALLDNTDDAVGVFTPTGDPERHEGILFFSGRYADADFGHALAIAASRHGSTPAPQSATSGQLYALGDATLAQLDQWTWAVAVGAGARAHLAQVSLGGGRAFRQNLLEFGARIGLPSGSAQAWANQDTQAGVDMVALVFAGENPQMVHNFVATVSRHLHL